MGLKMTKIVLFSTNKKIVEQICTCLAGPDYRILIVPTSENLAEMVEENGPDMAFVDVTAPEGKEVDQVEMLKQSRSLSSIPILLAVEREQIEHKERGIRLGIEDIIHKPLDACELMLRIRNIARSKALSDFPQDVQDMLRLLRKTKNDLDNSLTDVILRLCWVAEHCDADVPDHLRRVSRFSRFVAEKMGRSESELSLIERASPMHDIGKTGVPDAILSKPGPLTADEYEFAKTHTTIGADILLGSDIPLVQMAERIARYHHEKWDGTGYPEGLAGEQIPWEARIVAVVDVFDALATPRCYKEALPMERCFEILREGSGKHFDPGIAGVFLNTAQETIRGTQIHP